MLACAVFKPILATVAVHVFRLYATWRVPVGTFPAESFAKARAGRTQAVMQRRFTNPASRLVLAERPMSGVQEAQSLRDPRAQIFTIDLERQVAPYVDLPQISRRMPIADPFGNDFAYAAGRLQTNGVESRRHETVRKFRRLAELIAYIRRKTFRSAEELLNARFCQCRHTTHSIKQHRLKLSEVTSDLAEGEILRNPVGAPGARVRLEGPDK